MKKGIAILSLCLVFAASGCATRPYAFKAQEPVQKMNDRQPTAVPESMEFEFVEYAVDSALRHPVVESLDVIRGEE